MTAVRVGRGKVQVVGTHDREQLTCEACEACEDLGNEVQFYWQLVA